MLGADRKLLEGETFAAFVDPGHRDQWNSALARALERKERQAFGARLVRKDGAHFHGWLQVQPVETDRGPAVRVGLADITEFSRMAEELRASQAQLEVAARLAALGTLVAGIGHEINNPLSATLADTELALETVREVRNRLRTSDTVDGRAEALHLDTVVEELKDAQEGARRIETIVQDLKAFGHSDSRRTRIRLVDVVDLAMRWLPSTVGSAAKATKVGSRGSIVVRVGPGASGMARLEVIDHGRGIDPNTASRIFDPFFTTGDVGEGIGIGIAVSHALVVAHGGTLTVESEVGKGCTFRVELPAAPAEA
jgi:signal transduction histidine kinase